MANRAHTQITYHDAKDDIDMFPLFVVVSFYYPSLSSVVAFLAKMQNIFIHILLYI